MYTDNDIKNDVKLLKKAKRLLELQEQEEKILETLRPIRNEMYEIKKEIRKNYETADVVEYKAKEYVRTLN